MQPGIDLSPIYTLRSNFTIIGLTGRTGSGYVDIAMQLTKGFNKKDYPNPDSFDLSHNSYKKYKIAYNYATENFKKFTLIRYRDVIALYLTKYSYGCFISFLKSDDLKNFFLKSKAKVEYDFTEEIKILATLESTFNDIHARFSEINYEDELRKAEWAPKLNELFLDSTFQTFCTDFHRSLQKSSFVKHNILMEILTTNMRKSGNPYRSDGKDSNNLFSIAKLINSIIKAIRKSNQDSTKIVIESFRNSLEIMYFKQRYSAFYVIAVNRENPIRESELKKAYGPEYDNVKKILENEYTGGKGKGFYRQYVRDCIEKADIHISFRDINETQELNDALSEKRKAGQDTTSPYYSWPMQLIKYIALIEHPGLVTPSPEERCMQLAYTAKYNSGCISRQVGAAICDEYYSIKAIGWNNTPSGQVPCVIRDARVLLGSIEGSPNNSNSKNFDLELQAFTPYERNNAEFKEALKYHYKNAIDSNEHLLKGRNVCMCFKSLQNSCSEGKNQVHTRALHAEESAFLQITKYGGTAIKNGKLFTTASPCELCAKKAYQLGIKVIYYVDPYPGISTEQILSAGTTPPELRLFNGAIGNAYHWLYEPFMAYKDELSLILGLEIKDKLSKLEEENSKMHLENEELKKQLSELKGNK
ncbi:MULTISPECIES: hypothetical protein [Niastella]|uniref:CMP/dCMP-type deaminase domain-containing protein n=1 Tax=Niastella soli TaxID=2821487 RepID=A0ABS3YNF5_9BACT|nr:hypothetical protein [Niastella soli]MBO9199424.1 hypothetical protein [Niastella soli]